MFFIKKKTVSIQFLDDLFKGLIRQMHSWDRENYIFQKVTKMGSIIGQKIDYNGVGAPRGQRHIPSKH